MIVPLIRGARLKPLRPLRVNLGHPMAQGLAAFLYWPTKAGLWDAVTGSFTTTSTGAPSVAATNEGPAFYMPADTRADINPLRNALGLDVGADTLIARMRLRAAVAGAGTAQIVGFKSTTNDRGLALGAVDDSLAWGTFNSNATLYLNQNTGTNDVGAGFKTLAVVARGDLGACHTDRYLDGVYIGADGGTGNGNSGGSGRRLMVGRDHTGYFTYPDADVAWAAAFYRRLTVDEIAAWHRDPFAVLESHPDRRLWGVTAPGGGSTVSGDASVAGVAAASFTGISTAAASISIAGVASASFTGAAAGAGVLSSAGVASVAFTGEAVIGGALSAAGVGAAAFVGDTAGTTESGALSVAGVAAASFIGASYADAVGSAAGVAAASFAGASIAEAVLTAAGAATVAWSAPSVAEGVFSAAGAASVGFVSLSANGVAAYPSRKAKGKRRKVLVGDRVFWSDQKAAIARAIAELQAERAQARAEKQARPAAAPQIAPVAEMSFAPLAGITAADIKAMQADDDEDDIECLLMCL